MKYIIKATSKFKKDIKRAQRRGLNLEELERIINNIASGKKLPKRNSDHELKGAYKDKRECHVRPDWLLIYELSHDEKVLYLIRTGSHSDLFEQY